MEEEYRRGDHRGAAPTAIVEGGGELRAKLDGGERGARVVVKRVQCPPACKRATASRVVTSIVGSDRTVFEEIDREFREIIFTDPATHL